MQTSTYTALIKSADISPETESLLSAYAALFGRVERKLYASLCADKMTANERKSHFIAKHQISGRQYNAILRTLTGKLDSKRELNKLYQSEKKERIEAVSGTLSRLQSQADMLSKTGGVPSEIKKYASKRTRSPGTGPGWLNSLRNSQTTPARSPPCVLARKNYSISSFS